MTSRTAKSVLALSGVVVIGALFFAPFGCGTAGKGPQIKTASEIQPDALYAEDAVVNYGGIPVKVKMTRKVEGSTINFDLIAYNEALDTEVYKLVADAFSVVSVNGETFKQPIPLLKFPMRIGDTWTWEGELVSGSTPSKVKSVIRTSQESLLLEKWGSIETIKSVVTLNIDSGVQTPAVRTLTFWFAFGPNLHGIVQREFGKDTSRKPSS